MSLIYSSLPQNIDRILDKLHHINKVVQQDYWNYTYPDRNKKKNLYPSHGDPFGHKDAICEKTSLDSDFRDVATKTNHGSNRTNNDWFCHRAKPRCVHGRWGHSRGACLCACSPNACGDHAHRDSKRGRDE